MTQLNILNKNRSFHCLVIKNDTIKFNDRRRHRHYL